MQCDNCGSSPAALIKLRRGVGLLILARVYTAAVNLCDRCAGKLTADFQKQTLIKGWLSPRSVLMNPFYIASNAINKSKHKRKLRDS